MKLFAAAVLAGLMGSAPAFGFTSTFGLTKNRLDFMSLDARKPFIAGNWKMNPTTVDEARTLAGGIADACTAATPAEVALFVPACFLSPAMDAVSKSDVKIGAEYCYEKEKGAFTGAISADQVCIIFIAINQSINHCQSINQNQSINQSLPSINQSLPMLPSHNY